MYGELTLMPEVEARAVLALVKGKALRERVLAPPFAALGLGRLRVLRITEADDAVELVCGYEGYERL